MWARRSTPTRRSSDRTPKNSRAVSRPASTAPARVARLRALARPCDCSFMPRPLRRALADGSVARLPHHLRGHRHRAAGAHGHRRDALAAHGRCHVSRAREALGERRGDPLRGGRRLRHRAQLRARAALARVHEAGGSDHRHAVLARRLRVLHRGDLPRHLSLRVGPDLRRARTCSRASSSR